MRPPDTDTIVITPPAGTKARWVRAAQAHDLTLSDYITQSVDRPPNRTARTPCPRCGSVLLVADGPTDWQCGQCGLAS
jgi:ribosomal protein S27AE